MKLYLENAVDSFMKEGLSKISNNKIILLQIYFRTQNKNNIFITKTQSYHKSELNILINTTYELFNLMENRKVIANDSITEIKFKYRILK